MINGTERTGNDICLIVTGDIMLGGEFLKFKEEENVSYEYPFEALTEVFAQADIIFGNLECPLSRGGPARVDTNIVLKTPPASVTALKYLNYDVVSLANNHVNDYGEEGLVETIEILRKNHIPCVGAGRNLEEASQEVTHDRNGLRISFFGYTASEKHGGSIIADADTAGCAPYDFSKIKSDIDRIKNHCDVICISLHWGFEGYVYPSPQQVELAHKIIDAGAHIVVGHHPHVIQGFERYKHGVIFYSLGNFFFPDFYTKSGTLHQWPEESNRSLVARCWINKAKVTRVEPCFTFMNRDYRLAILDGDEREKAMSEIKRLSQDITKDDYKSFWIAYEQKRIQKLAKALLPRVNELGFKGCIRQISLSEMKYTVLILTKYLLIKLRLLR